MLVLFLISEQGLTIYDSRSIVDFRTSVFHSTFLQKSKIVNRYS